MRKIAVLDQQTIDKIAAGEVVERPSSIVKELVENAIDAGATAVTVEITDGGKKMIRITDNGGGKEIRYPWHFCVMPPVRLRRLRIWNTLRLLDFAVRLCPALPLLHRWN